MCVQGPALVDTLQHQINPAFAVERKTFLRVALGAAVFLQKRMASPASAAADGKATAQRIESVQPPSPGVALDMIIAMKMAKNLRELSAKIEAEDWGAVSSFLTSPWNSGTARFVRKNQASNHPTSIAYHTQLSFPFASYFCFFLTINPCAAAASAAAAAAAPTSL